MATRSNAGLFFNRVLVAGDSGADVIELFFVVFSQQVFDMQFFGSGWLEWFRRAEKLVEWLSGAGEWSGGVPDFVSDSQELLALIPKEFFAGVTFPKFEFVMGSAPVYWQSPAHYLFQEGSLTFLSLPQFRSTWGLSLEGLLCFGASCVYYQAGVAQYPSIVPEPNSPTYYNGVEIPRAGVWVYQPREVTGAAVPVKVYDYFVSGAYPHRPYASAVDIAWLWAYPPESVGQGHDLRYDDLGQVLEYHAGIEGGYSGALWLCDNAPAPNGNVGRLPLPLESSGLRSETEYTGRRSDYIDAVLYPPIIFNRPRLERPPRRIPIPPGPPWRFPPLPGLPIPPLKKWTEGGGGGGGASGTWEPPFEDWVDGLNDWPINGGASGTWTPDTGRLCTIIEKLLMLNGRYLRAPRG